MGPCWHHWPRHRAAPVELELVAAAAGVWQCSLAQAPHEQTDRPGQGQGSHVTAPTSLSCLSPTRHLWWREVQLGQGRLPLSSVLTV